MSTLQRMLPPRDCDVCHHVVVFCKDESSKREWPFIYRCNGCGATVGCHPNSNNPLGYMANAYVRKLRARLHEIVDPLWRSGYTTRTKVYEWIAFELDIESSIAHISQLSLIQLLRAVEFCSIEVALIENRQAKKDRNALQQRKTSSNKRSKRRGKAILRSNKRLW